MYKTVEAQAKTNSYLKNCEFGQWLHYFCREFTDPMRPEGGHFAPLISATESGAGSGGKFAEYSGSNQAFFEYMCFS